MKIGSQQWKPIFFFSEIFLLADFSSRWPLGTLWPRTSVMSMCGGNEQSHDSNSECNPAEPTNILQIFLNFCNHLKLPFNNIYHRIGCRFPYRGPKKGPTWDPLKNVRGLSGNPRRIGRAIGDPERTRRGPNFYENL